MAALSGRAAESLPGSGPLATNSAANATLAAAITGTTGGLIKQGAGTLTLAGTNRYSGGTTVSGGTLQGNTASLQGAILNNGDGRSTRKHWHLWRRHVGQRQPGQDRRRAR